MKRIVTSGVAIAATLTVADLALPGGAATQGRADASGPHYYTTKTPYGPQESPRDYQPVPKGFAPVFTENVTRHGSRAMTDSGDSDAVLEVLDSAKGQDALTPRGAKLGPQVRTLLSGATTIGYGNLSGRGAQEQRDTALRMERRLPSLFSDIAADHEPIEVETSGVARAVASADAFTDGLTADDLSLAGQIQLAF